MKTPRFNPRRSKGFTLLEVILAVTIAGALLAAAATLMVAITDAWLKRQDRHFFEDHVDGVTEFLQASFTYAGSEVSIESNQSIDNNQRVPEESEGSETGEPKPGLSIDAPSGGDRTGGGTANGGDAGGGSLLRMAEEPIKWKSPPGFASYEDPLISFRLKERPALLVQADNAPIVGVEAYIHFSKDEGLSLLWFTPIQEASGDLNDLYRTPLSDLVTKVAFIYWDERFERWETEEEPLEGEGDEPFILPRFLKLTFAYEGVEKERTITLPVPSLSVPIF